MKAAMVKAATVEPMKVMEMVETTEEEDRPPDKGRPIEPGIPVWLGVLIQMDRLRRQYVDLLRQAGRILGDPPAAIGLLARPTDGLLLLSSNRHRRGELAAILKGRLRWDDCCVRRARGNRPGTPCQDQHYCDS